MTFLPGEPGLWRLDGDGFSIEQLRIPAPQLHIRECSVYLLTAGDDRLLVDCAPADDPSWPALEAELAARDLGPGDIGTVLVTHAHPDHYGNAGRFQAAGARVVLHRADLAFHRQRNGDQSGYRERTFAWLGRQGVPEAERRDWVASRMEKMSSRPLHPDVLVDGGEVIPVGPLRLRVDWTPGHTPGHVVLHEASRGLVFLGDHVLPTASPNIGIDQDNARGPAGNPLPRYLESLREYMERPDLVALPGHGHVFDLVSRSRQILEHQEERSRRVLRAVEAGARTAYEVRPFAWDDATWGGLGKGLRVNAIRTLAAHLERLGELGLVIRDERDGVVGWRPADGGTGDELAGPGEAASDATEHD